MAGLRENKGALMVIMYVLLTATVSVLIAACASNRWLVSRFTEQGLWNVCYRGVCMHVQERGGDETEQGLFRAARAFMILAVLLSIAWTIVSLIGESLKGRKDISKATMTLGCITAALSIATGSLYLGYAEPAKNSWYDTETYSGGFALVWVAVPLAIGAAVLSYFHFKNMVEQFQAAGNQSIPRQNTVVSVIPVGQPVGQSSGQPHMAQPVYPSQQQTPQQPMVAQPMVAQPMVAQFMVVQPYPAHAYPQAAQAPPQAPVTQPAMAQTRPPYGNVAD